MRKEKSMRKLLVLAITVAMGASLFLQAGAAVYSKMIEVFPDVNIFINGVKLEPKDANGKPVDVFIYQGTTYVPLRAVSQGLGEDVAYESTTRSVYIGKNTPGVKYLMDVCPPYETDVWFETPDHFVMSGKSYTNGFTMCPHYSGGTGVGYGIWNLNGKYNTLEFDLGHVDGTSMSDNTITIYLNGTVSQVISAKAESLPQHFSVNLNGALQMKITIDGGYKERYGFANITVK